MALVLWAPVLYGVDRPNLPSLRGQDAETLKREIEENLRSSRARDVLRHPLRIVAYRLAKGEDFFLVVTKLSQDPDTLASLNNLAHPQSVGPGDRILIPNARGLFREQKEAGSQEVALDQGAILHFLPGRRFTQRERDYFRGIVFAYPLHHARLTSGYGWRRDPLNGRPGFHQGLDLAAPEGTPVLSAGNGTVVFAGERAGYGKAVLVQHEFGYVTVYGHLSRVDVKVGEKLRQGAQLGRVGRTGRVTGPHLHYEVWKRGVHRPPDFNRPHK